MSTNKNTPLCDWSPPSKDFQMGSHGLKGTYYLRKAPQWFYCSPGKTDKLLCNWLFFPSPLLLLFIYFLSLICLILYPYFLPTQETLVKCLTLAPSSYSSLRDMGKNRLKILFSFWKLVRISFYLWSLRISQDTPSVCFFSLGLPGAQWTLSIWRLDQQVLQIIIFFYYMIITFLSSIFHSPFNSPANCLLRPLDVSSKCLIISSLNLFVKS